MGCSRRSLGQLRTMNTLLLNHMGCRIFNRRFQKNDGLLGSNKQASRQDAVGRQLWGNLFCLRHPPEEGPLFQELPRETHEAGLTFTSQNQSAHYACQVATGQKGETPSSCWLIVENPFNTPLQQQPWQKRLNLFGDGSPTQQKQAVKTGCTDSNNAECLQLTS